MEYRLVGPYRGGRVSTVAGVPGRPNTFYFGSTGGGVWKTEDSGMNWSNISDGYFKSGSVGALAIAASDPNVVYAGMGEACIRHNVSSGDGIYKSIDGGRTWRHSGLEHAGQIGRLRIHPQNPDLVYAAVLGHAFGPNQERGVFRSTDGGKTWERVLFVSDRAGAVDLAMDPSNPRILYAAMWEAVRKPWIFVSGGAGGGLYQSMDGGDSWEELTVGLPAGIKGRMGVTVSAAKPSRVWALVEAEMGGLYRSDDWGGAFRRISDDPVLVARAYYYTHVFADPLDEDVVYVLNTSFLKSIDGGTHFAKISTPHADNHDLWLNPTNPQIMIEANDGGAAISFNGGISWSTQANQPTAELYRVTVDNQFLYRLYAGQQDNSTISIPSRTATAGISLRHSYSVGGGEQGHIAVDPRDTNIVFAGNYEGIITRYDHSTGEVRNIMSYPELGEGKPTIDYKYRFQVHAPVRVSPHNPSILYHTSQFVHRSMDEGQSWGIISQDLTRNDKAKQVSSGGPITKDNWSDTTYGTIFAFEESSQTPGLLWAGSDDGLVHISRDGGRSWTNITPPDMPEWGTVNMIELSAHDPGRALIAVHRYRDDDFAPYIFRTNDYGKSWKRLTDGRNGIPPKHFVRAVREDPNRRGLLYAGTEYGMYISFDDGVRWGPFQLNLPVTPITDLAVYRGDLVVATQGRSFWILDDLTPLHQLSHEVVAAKAYLYRPRASYRIARAARGLDESEIVMAKNPADGVVVYYQLGETTKNEVRLEFLDSSGRVVQEFSSLEGHEEDDHGGKESELSIELGLNRFVWDFRYPAAEVIDGAIFIRSTRGPKAVPGTYQVRLSVGSLSETRSFEILKDPRTAATQKELEEQFELSIRIRDRLSETHGAVRSIRDVRAQMKHLEEHAAKSAAPAATKQIAEATQTIDAKLTAIEDVLIQRRLRISDDMLANSPKLDNELVFLMNAIQGADTRPTDAAYQRYEDLEGILIEQITQLQHVVDADVRALNTLAEKLQLQAVVLPEH
jgi:photosystem II stability/assembly factor-like uncharacterized protein